jgi:hypothetical protein
LVAKLQHRALTRARRLFGAAEPRSDQDELARTLERVLPLTMVPPETLIHLAGVVRSALADGIPGDFVECGVWRGGAAFLMADLVRSAGVRDRKVWLMDSFEGLPPVEDIDGPAALEYTRNTDSSWYYENCRASIDDVRQSANALGLSSYTRMVKGWFEETLPATRDEIGAIAVLRLDCDWYASVRCCLEALYDQVAPGGYIIMDDYYTWDGCAVAVHEFLGTRRLAHRIRTGPNLAFFRKS